MQFKPINAVPMSGSSRAWKVVRVRGASQIQTPVLGRRLVPGWNWVRPERRYIYTDEKVYRQGFHAWLTSKPPWERIRIRGPLIPVWLAGIVATGLEYGAPVAVAEAMYIDPEEYDRVLRSYAERNHGRASAS